MESQFGHQSASHATLNYRFNFIGQNWQFLDPQSAGFEGAAFDRHASINSAIHNAEKVTIKERVTEHYRKKLKEDISESATLNSTVSGVSSDTNDTSISVSLSSQLIHGGNIEGQKLTAEEALELETSLNMLRMFYDYRSHEENASSQEKVSVLFDGVHSTQPSKMCESPRAAVKVDSIRMTESLLAATPSSAHSRERTIQQLKDEIQKNSLKRLLDAEIGKSPKKIGLTMAEKMKLRMSNATEQLQRIDISKNFKKYMLEKGLRIPHFLKKVDHTIASKDNEKQQADLKALYANTRPTGFRSSTMSPRTATIINKSASDGNQQYKGNNASIAQAVATAVSESTTMSISHRSLPASQVKTSQFATSSSISRDISTVSTSSASVPQPQGVLQSKHPQMIPTEPETESAVVDDDEEPASRSHRPRTNARIESRPAVTFGPETK